MQIIEQMNLGRHKTMELFHMTKKENVDSILRNGFDITKVRPRWMNDYAISFMKKKNDALGFFTKGRFSGNEEIDSNLVLLKCKFIGTIISQDATDKIEINSNVYDRKSGRMIRLNNLEIAKIYTEKILQHKIDAVEAGNAIYVYNPKTIKNIQIENFR